MLDLDVDINRYQYCENQKQLKAIEQFYEKRSLPIKLSVYDHVDNILKFTFNRKNQITLKELIKAEMKYKTIMIEETLIKSIQKKLKELESELKQSKLMLKEADSADDIWLTVEKKKNTSSITVEKLCVRKIDITNLTFANNAFLDSNGLYPQIFDIEKTRQYIKINKKKGSKRLGSLKPEPINPQVTEEDVKTVILQIFKRESQENLLDIEITQLVNNFIKIGMKWASLNNSAIKKNSKSSQIKLTLELFGTYQLRFQQRMFNLTNFIQQQANYLVQYLKQKKHPFKLQNINEELISYNQERATNKLIKFLIKTNLLGYLGSSNELKQEIIRNRIKNYIFNLLEQEAANFDQMNFETFIIVMSARCFYQNPINHQITLIEFSKEITQKLEDIIDNIQQNADCFNFQLFTRKEVEILYIRYFGKENILKISENNQEILQKVKASPEFEQRKTVCESAIQTLYNSLNKDKSDITEDFFKVYNEKLQQPNFDIETVIKEIFFNLIKQYLLEIQQEF